MTKYIVVFHGDKNRLSQLNEGDVIYDHRLRRNGERGMARGFENTSRGLEYVVRSRDGVRRVSLPERGATGRKLGLRNFRFIRRTPEG